MWREHAVNKWADATGGEGLERSFWNEVKAKNWNELERHIAGNYILITSEGRLDRAPALERLKELQIQDFSIGEIVNDSYYRMKQYHADCPQNLPLGRNILIFNNIYKHPNLKGQNQCRQNQQRAYR